MKALLEDKHAELERARETASEIALVVDTEADLQNLAARCRELLARMQPPAECPPGHWLG